MEILDPAQNAAFHDNYLDLPFDLSGVFFMCTANSPDPIPRPLLDRMEVLRLPGYSAEEKLEIAKRHLIPARLRDTGLEEGTLSIPDDTLARVISRYTNEAGLRELDRSLARLTRKAAMRLGNGETPPLQVERDALSDWLGTELFFPEKARSNPVPGVVPGLAWTATGGQILYVEATLIPGGGGLRLTGSLGRVLQESAQTALSLIRSHGESLGIPLNAFKDYGVHIHLPEGSLPKDGPSAGVTVVTALISLYLNSPVVQGVAMTGEVTLTGLVLPVGGIREKMLAAHRAGLCRVILPHRNLKDLAELPDRVREAMEFVPVKRIEDILRAAIPGPEWVLRAATVEAPVDKEEEAAKSPDTEDEQAEEKPGEGKQSPDSVPSHQKALCPRQGSSVHSGSGEQSG